MITLHNIEKTYQTRQGRLDALKQINLTIHSGEIFGVIGESGAGKSTLLRVINLLERPTAGTVTLRDQELTALSVSELRQVRQKMGMVFQHFNLLSSRTVFDNVALPLRIRGCDKSNIRQRVHALLDWVGLSDKARSYPNELSGGQKQRVAIARALANQPDVLLCDEMTSALDPQTTISILNLIQSINDEFGVTVFLITHEMDVIKRVADRVAVMAEGRIIATQTVDALFRHPDHEQVKPLIQSAFSETLPSFLTKQLRPATDRAASEQESTVLQITFFGDQTLQPWVYQLVAHHQLSLNILQAHIEPIRHSVIGRLIIAVYGPSEHINAFISDATQHQLTIEVLGYVDRHVSCLD